MEVMWIVLPLALGIAAVAVIVFAWAVRTGQFDDLVTPGMRILPDDEPQPPGDEPAGEGDGGTGASLPTSSRGERGRTTDAAATSGPRRSSCDR